jgi:hypothetical protein
MSLLRFTEWLQNTALSTAFRESILVYPLVETTHVLTLTLFLGLIAMMDLRLLGLTMRRVPLTDFVKRLLPWAAIGFVLSVITGVLLFSSSPVRNAHNIFFRYKLIALALAGVNAWLFHTGIYRKVADWDRELVVPRRAKIAGALSLALWASIVVSGRMIAYNWFDCDKPQPAIVNLLAGCSEDFR